MTRRGRPAKVTPVTSQESAHPRRKRVDICGLTSEGGRFNRLAGFVMHKWSYKCGFGVCRQAHTLSFLLVIDGSLDFSMQHVVAGQD